MANHKYEVWVETGVGLLVHKFPPEEYETDEDQYEHVLDLIRGCRLSGTRYTVFRDDQLANL